MNLLKHYVYLLRLHRPMPIFLLIWPTMWALLIASQGKPSMKLILIFCFGALTVRSSGVIMNDLMDRKFDRQVERTKNRPIASGKVSVLEALILCGFLLAIAFGLVLMLNPLTIKLAFFAIGLTFVYPFMKRFTHFPQVILGISFNWGILMAFSATINHLPVIAFYLLGIATLWTVSYDTIYALADQKDDIEIGIKSTAVLFGQRSALFIAALQLVVLGLLMALGLSLHYNIWFYSALGVCVFFFYSQHKMLGVGSMKAFIDAFSNNHWVGMVIFLGFALQYVK